MRDLRQINHVIALAAVSENALGRIDLVFLTVAFLDAHAPHQHLAVAEALDIDLFADIPRIAVQSLGSIRSNVEQQRAIAALGGQEGLAFKGNRELEERDLRCDVEFDLEEQGLDKSPKFCIDLAVDVEDRDRRQGGRAVVPFVEKVTDQFVDTHLAVPVRIIQVEIDHNPDHALGSGAGNAEVQLGSGKEFTAKDQLRHVRALAGRLVRVADVQAP